VPRNATITATFSVAMDALTIVGTSFLLQDGVVSIPAAVTYAGTSASLTPVDVLDPDTLYTATITTGATDLGGNPLEPVAVPCATRRRQD
jgi:hypothetical protein